MCRFSLHLAFSLFIIHPSSLLFLEGHFQTTPDHDFTDSDIHEFLPYFTVLQAQDVRHSALASRCLATWPDHMQTPDDLDCSFETDESAKDVVDAPDSHVQGSGLRETLGTAAARRKTLWLSRKRGTKSPPKS